MRISPLVTTAALVVAVSATSAVAFAQNANTYSVSQVTSDITMAVSTLQRDQADYGGHRVRAIGHLRAAQRELDASLNFAQAHAYPLPAGSAHGHYPSWERVNQAASDENIIRVQQHAQAWINQLEADGAGYGGHRLQAIDSIRAAQNELALDIQYARSHGR
jgi:hypothetical protein